MAVAVENFQAELEKARETLNKVDENIKKITGRDPTEARNARFQSQVGNNEGRENAQARNRIPPRFQGRLSSRDEQEKRHDGPTHTKRIVREGNDGRPTPLVAIGNPKGWRNDDYEEGELPRKGAIHSSITAPNADRKTREEALAQQSKDVKVKDRNRRMFGSLLGTLAKFRMEESSQKDKEEKRARIEQRLEETARQEKESLRKERNELFMERKRQQAHVRRLEWKMHRLREHDEWATRQQPLMKFIKLTTTPPLYYKPKVWTPKTEELIKESQRKLKEMLETRRKELEEELLRVEEKAIARLERVRERGYRVAPASEQDAELEELEAEIEMYALALGEEKEEDMELHPEKVSQGPLTFPKHDPDEPMDSA
ncbi:pinin-like [Daphnia pulicaria]|uniref:pinin-like n=1 Tax=Daphnia pulicaria TaxID=35523 RepID=UPI001EEADA52|nr:pinin-like [Daphnia pulicaria]